MLGGDSEREPPDTIPNSVVKTLSADDSVGFPHVKIGHRQALFLLMRPISWYLRLVDGSSSGRVQCGAGGGERLERRAVQPSAEPAGLAVAVNNSKFDYGCRVICGDVSGDKSDTCT